MAQTSRCVGFEIFFCPHRPFQSRSMPQGPTVQLSARLSRSARRVGDRRRGRGRAGAGRLQVARPLVRIASTGCSRAVVFQVAQAAFQVAATTFQVAATTFQAVQVVAVVEERPRATLTAANRGSPLSVVSKSCVLFSSQSELRVFHVNEKIDGQNTFHTF